MDRKQFLSLIIIVACGFEIIFASPRSSFGQECSKTMKCDRKAWLSCYNDTCGCSKREEMVYVEERGKCVTKAGERCKYGVEVDDSEEPSLIEVTDCVANSVCSDDGICVCDIGYQEIFNGTCGVSKLFGENCSEVEKCSEFHKLRCINGQCACQERFSYSETYSQCVGGLNEDCVNSKCSEGLECQNGKCVCDLDHYLDSSNTTCLLRKGMNENCSSDAECVDKDHLTLNCRNGICNCKEGYAISKIKSEIIVLQKQGIINGDDDFMEICAPLIGNECPEGICGTNANCVFQNEVSVCTCEEPYPFVNRDKTKCGRKWFSPEQNHGEDQKCEISEDCLNNLVCYEGKCQCSSPMLQEVSNDEEYCQSKEGGFCTEDSNCIDTAFCELLPNSTVGHCRCREGWIENFDGDCKRSHGSSCNYISDDNDESCDQTADLVCIDQKCSCKDSFMQIYSASKRKCLGFVDAICEDTASCVDNAECFKFNDKLTGRCKCRKGYTENANFTCDNAAILSI